MKYLVLAGGILWATLAQELAQQPIGILFQLVAPSHYAIFRQSGATKILDSALCGEC